MAEHVEIITTGTDALGGWNLMIPIMVAELTGLIAIAFKAVAAFKALQTAIAAGAGISTVMSGGTIGAIIAAVTALSAIITMIAGAASAANDIEKTDYSSTITALSSYRDNIDALVSELETLAAKTELSAAEQARADEIMRILSGTSLTMKAALENGGEGFDTLGEKAAAARGEVQKTEQALRSLNAADALQNLRDTDHTYANGISDAQERVAASLQYGNIAEAYAGYMQKHPTGKYKKSYSGAMGTSATKEEGASHILCKRQSSVE